MLLAAELYPALPDECETGRQIAADTISPNVAAGETFRRVHAQTGCSVFVHRQDGRVTGTLGLVPLRPEGLVAVMSHHFDSIDPPHHQVCWPGDPMPGLYGWGFAASTRKASACVVQGSILLREFLFDIPCFTRAATPAGVKVICGRMGYEPVPGAPDDLLWHPVRLAEECAA